jgi:TolB-like protein
MKMFHWMVIIVVVVTVAVVDYAHTNQLTLAVLDFKDNSPFPSADLKPMEQGLANMMITTFTQIGGIRVIERSQMQALFQEMALGQSGMLDEQTAQQVGKLSGAQFLVLGSFMKGMKDDIRIDVRIVKTETGVTLKAEESSGKLKDILKLVSRLEEKIVADLEIKIEAQEKNNLENLDGGCSQDLVMQYFKAVELIDAKQFRKADAALGEILKKCPEFKRAAITRHNMRLKLKEELQNK